MYRLSRNGRGDIKGLWILISFTGCNTDHVKSHQVGFKTFLNITPTITFPQAPNPATTAPSTGSTLNPTLPYPSEFILTLEENPLAEFAELPKDALPSVDAGGSEGLWFSNVLCGVLRGSLEMVCENGTSFHRLAVTLFDNNDGPFFFQIQLQTEVRFISDTLRGDDSTDIHVKLIKIMEEEQPVNDE
jgi:hypothetical protein